MNTLKKDKHCIFTVSKKSSVLLNLFQLFFPIFTAAGYLPFNGCLFTLRWFANIFTSEYIILREKLNLAWLFWFRLEPIFFANNTKEFAHF